MLPPALNDIAKDGWQFDGEVPPPTTTEERYVIKIRKWKSLML